MTRTPEWLSTPAVLAIHQQLLRTFGGPEGVRDEALLESALSRPQQLWRYNQPDVFDLAAAYAIGIARKHPFTDGKKRTAFTSAYVFLSINGYEIAAEEAEVVVMTRGLAAKEIEQAQYAAWLRDHVEEL